MENSNDSNEEYIGGIAKKISDGFYINVTRIPTHHIDYDQSEIEATGQVSEDEKSERNRKDNLRDENDSDPDDSGNETIGIP
ncbi:hypothetical protein J2X31_001202 [Flavobacterium arsenatis]|uniref:Uncharacterized protein n=1 Tax=Flavobacterium arsenatis TaxID=1484332 RepID=A0ABU1TMK3_9FLAO|nr:hypothetical protein [Flavobacterium arsenatis]MDR6967195.1 hypothetical protein [Flavobacterium arsenatis]